MKKLFIFLFSFLTFQLGMKDFTKFPLLFEAEASGIISFPSKSLGRRVFWEVV